MVTKIAVSDARRKVQAGEALLVCAYDSDEKFNQIPLEGAIALSDFRDRFASSAQENEVIFYCA